MGLPRKDEENDTDYYTSLPSELTGTITNMFGPNEDGPLNDIVNHYHTTVKENPEQYFNFGFTYEDFKAYLLKLTYCRAMRKIVERKRLERIEEFQKNNQFTFGMEAVTYDY